MAAAGATIITIIITITLIINITIKIPFKQDLAQTYEKMCHQRPNSQDLCRGSFFFLPALNLPCSPAINLSALAMK